jgi:hypothetical protein
MEYDETFTTEGSARQIRSLHKKLRFLTDRASNGDAPLTETEMELAGVERALDAITPGCYRMEDLSPEELAREIRIIQADLQLLADRPQLRRKRGYGRVSAEAPYADSRRPTDPRGGYRIDNRPRAGDADRNYAAGLL